MGPTTCQRPSSWLKLHKALGVPGGGVSPLSGLGRLGKQMGAGKSKLVGPSVCTVMTTGKSKSVGRTPGSRSGGTGAMPTWPPRAPSSAKRESAGTVMATPSSSGCSATTSGGKAMTVSSVWLTGCKEPGAIRGRKASPTLLSCPATDSHALPT